MEMTPALGQGRYNAEKKGGHGSTQLLHQRRLRLSAEGENFHG